MIRVFLADDHPVVRKGLQRILEEQPGITVAGEASDGEAMLASLLKVPADVLLLDVSMPGPGLVPLLQELRTAHPTLPVLVLSVHPEDQYALRALRAGARGYLTKDHSPEELVAAVRKVYRGGRYVSATLAERLAAEFDAAGSARAPHEDLSDREFEVLCLVGSGRSVTEVAATLGLSVKTVSTYRTRLLQKMAANSNADLVRYVATHGLMR